MPFFAVLLVLAQSVAMAQTNAFSLKGKRVVFADNLSSWHGPYQSAGGIYRIEATAKNKFSKKFFQTATLKGVDAYIEDVSVLFPDKHRKTAIVMTARQGKGGGGRFAIYIPLYYNELYLMSRTILWHRGDTASVSLKCYDVAQIDSINAKYAGKRFYLRDSTPYRFDRISVEGGDVSISYHDDKTKAAHQRSALSFLSRIALEDSLMAACKSRYDKHYIDSIAAKYERQEVWWMAVPGKRGFYQCDSVSMGRFYKDGHDFHYIMHLSNGERTLAVKVGEQSLEGIELASDYRERVRAETEEGERAEREEAEQTAREEAQQKRELIRKYGKRNAELILDGEVRIGFTKAMCVEAWGEPSDINRTITRRGTFEQWVYGIGCYLYFEADRLTGIQD